MMGTGLKGNIDIGCASPVPCLAESMNLSMGCARFPVPTFSDDLSVPDNYTTNCRIG
jgi:hypothetical protein